MERPYRPRAEMNLRVCKKLRINQPEVAVRFPTLLVLEFLLGHHGPPRRESAPRHCGDGREVRVVSRPSAPACSPAGMVLTMNFSSPATARQTRNFYQPDWLAKTSYIFINRGSSIEKAWDGSYQDVAKATDCVLLFCTICKDFVFYLDTYIFLSLKKCIYLWLLDSCLL
jgi:hypothetical protein